MNESNFLGNSAEMTDMYTLMFVQKDGNWWTFGACRLHWGLFESSWAYTVNCEVILYDYGWTNTITRILRLILVTQ